MQEILSKKVIGKRIRDLRIEYDLSQAFIAKVLNISRSNYSQIELGNQYPSFNTLHLIARYYSKSYNWILHGETHSVKNETLSEIDSLINGLEVALEGFKNSLKNLEQGIIEIKRKRLNF